VFYFKMKGGRREVSKPLIGLLDKLPRGLRQSYRSLQIREFPPRGGIGKTSQC